MRDGSVVPDSSTPASRKNIMEMIDIGSRRNRSRLSAGPLFRPQAITPRVQHVREVPYGAGVARC